MTSAPIGVPTSIMIAAAARTEVKATVTKAVAVDIDMALVKKRAAKATPITVRAVKERLLVSPYTIAAASIWNTKTTVPHFHIFFT